MGDPPSIRVEKMLVNSAANNHNTSVLFYDDESVSWPHIYNSRNSLSCEKKRAFSKEPNENGIDSVPFTSTLTLSTPRELYVVLANCKQGIESIDYKIHFLNPGGFYDAEFGVDEQARHIV